MRSVGSAIVVFGSVDVWSIPDDPDRGVQGEIQLEAFGGERRVRYQFVFDCLGDHPIELTISKDGVEFGRMRKEGACTDSQERGAQLAFFAEAVQIATQRYLEQMKRVDEGSAVSNSLCWSFECQPNPDRIVLLLELFD
ncbi:hypothetical protein FJZ48_02960 [Candidatus Uhrbacteria bacterium]|nr:hypothetical protein [Candidatus Uhrbacteria bacterium]